MNQKLLSFLKYLLLLAIAFGLLAFAFKGINVSKVMHEMLQANMFWVLLSALLSIIAMISRAFRWKLLIESTGHSSSLKNTFFALSIGYFANLALPRLGEVTRCGSLSRAEKIPFTNLLGTVIIERIIDVISLFICILLAAIIEYKRLGSFLQDNIIQPIINKLEHPVFIVAGILLLAALIAFIVWYVKKIKQKGKDSKWFQLIKELVNGLRSIAKLKRPWLFIFHSVFIWVLYFLATYVCFFALPATDHLELGAALFLLVAAGIAMSAPVQGGIGAYHLLVSQGLVLYGLSQQDGLAFATLLHTLSLAIFVFFGMASILLWVSGKKQKN